MEYFSKMSAVYFLVVAALAVSSASPLSQKIVGGSIITINQYPFAVSMLYSSNLVSYYQACAGTILTTRTILTAAHCVYGYSTSNWRARVGSSWANSAGTIHTLSKFIIHGSYSPYSLDSDVALVQTSSSITYGTTVKPASIAGSSYVLGDNQQVWAIGWGSIYDGGPGSEQLRHVQIWTINQSTCKSRYGELAKTVTDNMVCSGWLDVGGRDHCQGDAGGPLLHNNVVVGIASWGQSCGLPRYPGVNTRVSKFTSWIQANAI